MSEPLLPCLEVAPRSPARASVIFLHGLGADGHDFEPVVPLLRTDGVRFVFPHAPAIPITINGGFVMPGWYDIRSFSFDDAGREDATQIEATARRISALVQAERDRGIPADRIVIGGFSQGAAMAMHVGVRHPDRLAGVLALSGYLVLGDRLAKERSAANRATPMLLCHGHADDVVPIAAGRASLAALKATADPEATIEWNAFPIGHEVSPDEIAIVGAWLRARLG
ncbi:MAG TPA: alpha/beta fold hydrolase [Nannocystaceae bacterium]|nr:alpha/beta fold hydrolase [Nannocystaceae bacterium]